MTTGCCYFQLVGVLNSSLKLKEKFINISVRFDPHSFNLILTTHVNSLSISRSEIFNSSRVASWFYLLNVPSVFSGTFSSSLFWTWRQLAEKACCRRINVQQLNLRWSRRIAFYNWPVRVMLDGIQQPYYRNVIIMPTNGENNPVKLCH